MSDVTEGLGTAVEGGLLANAVETETGAGGGKACLNCGTALTGAHCHACGQRGDVHRSLGAIGHEILHGVLHLDGKIWRTLPLLAFKPGRLTRRYIDGERAKFVSPMAMFLFSVFLMFAVFQMLGLTAQGDVETDPKAVVSEIAESEAEKVARQLEKVEAQLDDATLSETERTELLKQQTNLAAELKLLRGEIPVAEWLARADGVEADESDVARAVDLADEKMDSFVKSDIPIVSNVVDKWRTNPDLMFYKMQTNAYKFSWLLIPLSIPFLWLMFAWQRRFKAYDHAIFVTYSLAFMSLLFVILSSLGRIGFTDSLITLATLVIPPLHIYKQLRGTYELSRFSALWRLFLLMIGIVIVLILFVQVLLLLGSG